jgi:uncharacterized membrane protein YsdA (DUF1294 family)/cold shock CspA family protein
MRHQGRISNWKDDKGFGFVTPNGGGQQAFVHIRSFSNRQRRPLGNELVSYELKADAQGRVQAVNVAFVGEHAASAKPVGRSNVPLGLAALFLAFVASSAFAGRLPFSVTGLYFAASFTAFVAYWLDKSAAKNDRWRTKESTLHLFALIGGWPGALAAQRLLRHKTQKASFQLVFWISVALNCGALGWLFWSPGAAAFRSALRFT